MTNQEVYTQLKNELMAFSSELDLGPCATLDLLELVTDIINKFEFKEESETTGQATGVEY